jgi:hypothetical protein
MLQVAAAEGFCIMPMRLAAAAAAACAGLATSEHSGLLWQHKCIIKFVRQYLCG